MKSLFLTALPTNPIQPWLAQKKRTTSRVAAFSSTRLPPCMPSSSACGRHPPRINRAFAVSRTEGAATGLALLVSSPELPTDSYPYSHPVRGVLLAELGRRDEAIAALEHAKARARNAAGAAQIEQRLRRLR
jgi:hypothetical protein